MNVLLTWHVEADELTFIGTKWPGGLEQHLLHDADDADHPAAIGQIEALVGTSSSIPLPLIERMPELKLIHVLGHGVDRLRAAATQIRDRGIAVARAAPGDIAIAEFVLMQMVALSRRVMQMHRRLAHEGLWSDEEKLRRSTGALGGELCGSTLGIVGYGAIGQRLHLLASALGMSVRLLRRQPDRHDQESAFVHAWDDIDGFLARCDYVVLTIPLNPDTAYLMDSRRLRAMKPGSYLINISRGHLVDETALARELESGHLAGAALDVFDCEVEGRRSGYPTASPLHHLNVLLTPHYASATAEARWRALSRVGENLGRLIEGVPLHGKVDTDALR